MTKSDAILVHLLYGNKAVRKGEYMWKWAEGKGPSLANPQTSKLFRADLVEEVNGEMTLTAMGKIIAEKV